MRKKNIRVLYKRGPTLGDRLKNNISKSPQSDFAENPNIIYNINCLNCNSSYTGQSSRTIETRAIEHANLLKKVIKTVKKPSDPKNRIVKHYVDCKHLQNWKTSSILKNGIQDLYERLWYEAWVSKSIPNPLNTYYQIPSIYDNIILKHPISKGRLVNLTSEIFNYNYNDAPKTSILRKSTPTNKCNKPPIRRSARIANQKL
jgi:hypothetical protein